MKIAVFGGSGGVGTEVLKQSLAKGYEIRAMLRDTGKLEIQDPRLEILTGDARNPDDVAAAIAGTEAVVSSLGTGGLGKTTIYSESIGHIISAMQANSVRRFVGVGAVGQDPERSRNMPFLGRLIIGVLLKPVLRDMYQMQVALEESDLDWTIAWPPHLSDAPETNKYRLEVDEALSRGSVVSRADLAHFLVNCLEDQSYFKRRVAIAY